MLENHMTERRLVRRLLDYWERLKGDEKLPDFDKFRPDVMPDVYQHCFTLSLLNDVRDKKTYKYIHVGDEVKRAYGRDPSGEWMNSSIHVVPGAEVVKKIDECMETFSPTFKQGQFINHNSEIVRFRSCIVPFGKRNERATHAVVGLSWRSFTG